MTDNSLKTWFHKRTTFCSHRQLLLLSGSLSWCQSQLQELAFPSNSLFVSERPLCPSKHNHKVIEKKQYKQYLGYEVSHVIYNAFDGLKPSALLGLEGTVQRGGLFIIVCPEIQKWPEYEAKNPGIQFSYREYHEQSAFIKRFLDLSIIDNNTAIYSQNDNECKLPLTQVTSLLSDFRKQKEDVLAACELTPQQQEIKTQQLGALKSGVSVSVVTAKRGRGKSTLIAHIAADYCLRHGCKKIYITAPHRHNCERALQEFAAYINTSTHSSEFMSNRFKSPTITYIPIDRISTLDKQSFLLIDEAASLAPELLLNACASFYKVLMASTQVGYEGSGLGFTLKVLPALEQASPPCFKSQLSSPIRWFENDVLEKCFEDAFAPKLCLSEDTLRSVGLFESDKLDLSAMTDTLRLSKLELIKNEDLFLSVFSILLQSHYQTTPDDLMRILDANDQIVFLTVLKSEHTNSRKVEALSAVLVQVEGGLVEDDTELMTKIASGNRRVSGHLVAQNLCTTYSIPEFMLRVSWRISRIAVRQKLQGYGLGTNLLKYVQKHAIDENNVVSLYTSFGISSNLYRFWEKNQFQFIKAGNRIDTSSGKNSVIMALPLTNSSTNMLNDLLELRSLHLGLVDKQAIFVDIRNSLDKQLSDSELNTHTSKMIIKQQLQDFIKGTRSFNLSTTSIYCAIRLIHHFLGSKSLPPGILKATEQSMDALSKLSAGSIPKAQRVELIASLRNDCKVLLDFYE